MGTCSPAQPHNCVGGARGSRAAGIADVRDLNREGTLPTAGKCVWNCFGEARGAGVCDGWGWAWLRKQTGRVVLAEGEFYPRPGACLLEDSGAVGRLAHGQWCPQKKDTTPKFHTGHGIPKSQGTGGRQGHRTGSWHPMKPGPEERRGVAWTQGREEDLGQGKRARLLSAPTSQGLVHGQRLGSGH